jgi:hypothetical protein
VGEGVTTEDFAHGRNPHSCRRVFIHRKFSDLRSTVKRVSPAPRLRGDCPTLPLGSVGYETKRTEAGEILIWMERRALDRLDALRRSGEEQRPDLIWWIE